MSISTQTTRIKVNNDFYKDYINTNLNNLGVNTVNNFQERLDKRITYLKTMFNLADSKWTDKEIIKENFVETFCWSVFPKKLLEEIANLLRRNNIFYIIDPCCGNGFHMYLFKVFTGFDIIAIDIQPEPHPWINTVSMLGHDNEKTPVYNGLILMPYYSDLCHKAGTYKYDQQCLFLSWIDRDDLALGLIDKFNGDIIMSVGHLDNVMVETCKHLDTNFELLKQYDLEMPWDITETVKIYKRKV